MSSVQNDAAANVPLFGNDLLLPLGVVCAAISLSILPLDSVEGLLSTAVGLGCVWLVQMFISMDRFEGVEAQQ